MNLQECIRKLETENRLQRIALEVDPKYELAGIAAKLAGGKPLLFEKVRGYSEPILCGLFWNREHLASLFDTSGRQLPFLLGEAIQKTDFKQYEPIVRERKCILSKAEEVEPDLYQIPIPTLALRDGGPYLSCGVIIAKDPDTGVRNSSVHRLMVVGKTRMTLLMDVGRHLRDYYERAEKRGESLEVTINLGVDPAVYFAAITPSSAVSMEQDELAIAGYLRKTPLELVKSATVDVEGVLDSQVILEGKILPYIREKEGPFAEVTGFYGEEDLRWVVEISQMTRQTSPLIQTLIPGKEVWNSVGLTAEASIFHSISRQIRGIQNVHLSHGGCGFYHGYIQMDPLRKGMAKNAILAAFAAFPPLQMVTVVNSDVDIFDVEEVQRAMATCMKPDEDMILIPKCFGHELNPATEGGYGSKVGFDCTYSLPRSNQYEKVVFQDVDIDHYL